MRTLPLLLLCSLFLLLFTRAHAQQTGAPWTIDDVLMTERMSNATFSPDGKMLLWSKRRPGKADAKDRFVSDLYLTRLDETEDGLPLTVQLTRTDDSDRSAIFSRDGKSIYFLSGREKGKKLWRMSVYGGEPEAVHEFKNGISSPVWKDDRTLIYRSNDGKSLREQELEEKKDNVIVVEDTTAWKRHRLYTFDLKTKESTRLTRDDKPVSSFSVSKDGQHLVYSLTGSPHQGSDAQPKSPFYYQNLTTGRRQRILEGLQGPGGFQFTDDGKGMYFGATKSSNPEWDGAGIGQLYYMNLADLSYQKIDLDHDLGVGGGFRVMGDDVWALLADRTSYQHALYTRDGSRWTRRNIATGFNEGVFQPLAFSDDRTRLVYVHSTAQQLPEYRLADYADGRVSNPRPLVKLNGKLAKKSITKREVVEWTGWKGEKVTGLLYYPNDYEEGRAYPLMLSIHGGPASADLDRWAERWSTYPQLLTQRGAFVLKPNYHGSNNHGLAYVESIKQNYYEPEMADIKAGIDWLIGRGLVDQDSVGTMGWSNGAILSTMLTVRFPELFRVAAPGAGDVNWTSDYGTCGFGVSFDQSYFGGAPWDDKNGKAYNENYILKSPLFEMEKVRTPTIIFHGSEDRAVPRDQGWEYYRALQQIAKAPVRFLWFPGQPHGLGKISHQRRKMEEELRWIDTYLFGKADKTNASFKKDSPLAMLLKKDTLARVAGNYGLRKGRYLIPETVLVKKDSISIGRFEVTNAQFAAFRPEHTYAANHGNHPVRVTRPEAREYLRWLSEQTGRTARLPSAAEATALHKQAKKVGAKENTLNYWAGYAITPDEVADLRRKMDDVQTTLYQAVGSFAPVRVGKATVYDLGGNVAEYAAGGQTYGFGAYDYVDPAGAGDRRNRDLGFRVVLEE